MQELSAGAKKILWHLHTGRFTQQVYELPGKLRALFDDPEECENAEAELEALGFIVLGPERQPHIPKPDRIRAAALTLDGERFIDRGGLG
jgi:hypothetical protein